MASSKGQACFAITTASPISVRSIVPPPVSKAPPPSPTDFPPAPPSPYLGAGRVAEGREASRRGFVRAPGGFATRRRGAGAALGLRSLRSPGRLSPVGATSGGRLATPPRPPPPAPMGRTAAAPHLRLGREGGRRRCRASEGGGGGSEGEGLSGSPPPALARGGRVRREWRRRLLEGRGGRRRRRGRAAPSPCSDRRPPAADLRKNARLSTPSWAERRPSALPAGEEAARQPASSASGEEPGQATITGPIGCRAEQLSRLAPSSRAS